MIDKEVSLVGDPGHGGYDPGAGGPGGTLEKNVTLAVALKTFKRLKQYPINLNLTRAGDSVSWPANLNADLQARCDFANALGASAFVSFHCDSFSNPAAEGTTAYCYEFGGEGERLARAIHTELLKVPEIKTGEVKAARDELIKAYGINYEMFAIPDHGLKEANFYVLRKTHMPATLIEMAFISNPEEEVLLADPAFQDQLAEAISTGILKYFGIDTTSGIDMGYPAIINGNRAYVPLNGFLEALGVGKVIGWDPDLGMATFTANGKTYVASFGSQSIQEV